MLFARSLLPSRCRESGRIGRRRCRVAGHRLRCCDRRLSAIRAPRTPRSAHPNLQRSLGPLTGPLSALYVGGRWGRSGTSHRLPRPGNAPEGRRLPRFYVAYAHTFLYYVPLRDRDAVDRARLDVPALLAAQGEGPNLGLFVFAPDPDPHARRVYSRMFAPHTSGVPEDPATGSRSEEHTSELQSRLHLVCRLLLEKKKKKKHHISINRQDQEPA